jgi:hypothetical protein
MKSAADETAFDRVEKRFMVRVPVLGNSKSCSVYRERG